MRPESQQSALRALFRAIASGDQELATRAIAADSALVHLPTAVGATRQDPATYYFEDIRHYAYAGDTALHLAAAAHAVEIARLLLSRGVSVRAANRRGAEPLHYAADGIPGSPGWKPGAQFAVIQLLSEAGADPNARDKDGAAPLHRAVRARCADAVRALLASGADARLGNKAGSTALHLAVQNTGRGGTGSAQAQEQQKQIIALLLEHGARSSDHDGKGKSVRDSVASAWVRELLDEA